ncbi:hypothetical protein HDK77DRAFT_241933 [Phyllosticta capitalensis]|uniref:Uncharacterized protein n=1 Tax=Phyllosticta capitalensis TaxID=121624 RepID=A0ABR1YMQ4_9PEZI
MHIPRPLPHFRLLSSLLSSLSKTLPSVVKNVPLAVVAPRGCIRNDLEHSCRSTCTDKRCTIVHFATLIRSTALVHFHRQLTQPLGLQSFKFESRRPAGLVPVTKCSSRLDLERFCIQAPVRRKNCNSSRGLRSKASMTPCPGHLSDGNGCRVPSAVVDRGGSCVCDNNMNEKQYQARIEAPKKHFASNKEIPELQSLPECLLCSYPRGRGLRRATYIMSAVVHVELLHNSSLIFGIQTLTLFDRPVSIPHSLYQPSQPKQSTCPRLSTCVPSTTTSSPSALSCKRATSALR